MRSGARRGLVLATLVMLAAGCGLPSGGARTVDDADVPYHLLSDRPDPEPDGTSDQSTSTGPLVFWVDPGGLLVPRPAPEPCRSDVEELLSGLLVTMSGGPSDQDRSDGLATALPPGSGLDLVEVDGDLVVVEVVTEAELSAERLPVAVGQVVLTMTSAPGIRQVSFVNDGEPVQIPLADGALTTTPVTPSDYVSLVPPRYHGSTPFRDEATTGPSCPPLLTR